MQNPLYNFHLQDILPSLKYEVLKYGADKKVKHRSFLMMEILLLCNLLTFNILYCDTGYQS